MCNVDKIATQLREYKRMKDELEALIDALQDEAKTAMLAAGTDELAGLESRISWKAVTTSSIDSKALKRDYPDIVKDYTRTTTTRRFVLA